MTVKSPTATAVQPAPSHSSRREREVGSGFSTRVVSTIAHLSDKVMRQDEAGR
jgi:hypothetical protein